MARSEAVWMKLECVNADILFRDHWAGLVEVVCGESRVMVSYSGRERLTSLPPDAVVELLRDLLEVARAERRNHDSAELLAAYLEPRVQQPVARPRANPGSDH